MKEHNNNQINPQELILTSDLPVLVDLYAEWCAPCMAMMPALERVEKVLEGKCLVIKVNVDDHLDLVSEYKVMGVPTIALFSQGKLKASVPGPLTSEQMLELVEKEAL
ncbi:thioredoxin domain-containing protein [Cytophagaceae bacterium ABcell3]|nr:thioredoxin domain-containing protein [Cytophagaceae bacterium ABcell3]